MQENRRIQEKKEISKGKLILFSITMIFVFFFIMEVGSRFYDLFFKSAPDYPELRHLEPYLMFSPAPNQDFQGSEVKFHINAYGFRGEEITKNKPVSTFRIVLLGGSVGFNGKTDSTTIVGYVGQLLKMQIYDSNSYKKIETINAAVPSYFSTQELLLLILKIVDLEPDLVIIFDGVNDWLGQSRDSRIGYPFLYSTLEKAIAPASFSKIFSEFIKLSSFLRHFKTWVKSFKNLLKNVAKKILSEKAVKKIRESKGKRLWISKDIRKKVVELYVNNHIKMQKICDGYNIKCLHINQPWIARKKYKTKSELTHVNMTRIKNIEIIEKEAIKRLNSIKDNNLLFFDFGNLFDDEKQTIYYDSCHFVDTDYSNLKIAREIVKIIDEKKLFLSKEAVL